MSLLHTEIQNAIVSSDKEAQYDKCAKRLLGNKEILARILIYTIDEFSDMQPEDVITLIEGEPIIDKVPVEPGLTNISDQPDKKGDRITGLNTEMFEKDEGLAIFDILFFVRMKDGISQIIVNVEAQRKDPDEYDILNRAIFYVSRLISSQKERDFVKRRYNDMKRVYSIWVCMNEEENSLNHFHLVDNKIVGNKTWKGMLDLFNIVMVGITNKESKAEEFPLHHLLNTLLSDEMSPKQKMDIIHSEYGIPMNADFEEEVSDMCNLSLGVREKAMQEKARSIIINMYEKNKSKEEIADLTNSTIEFVEDTIHGYETGHIDADGCEKMVV